MKLKIAATITALIGATITTAGADDNDILRHLLSKSELIVTGKIVSDIGEESGEAGVVGITFNLKISKVLAGTAPKGNEIFVSATLFYLKRPACLNKGSECILFLKKAGDGWTFADIWFGIQELNHEMAIRLANIAKEKAKKAEGEK